MIEKQNKQYADGDTKWWESLFGNLGGILTGSASVISASTGKPSTVVYVPENENKSNTGLYIIVGAVIIAVLVVTVLLLRKKK